MKYKIIFTMKAWVVVEAESEAFSAYEHMTADELLRRVVPGSHNGAEDERRGIHRLAEKDRRTAA